MQRGEVGFSETEQRFLPALNGKTKFGSLPGALPPALCHILAEVQREIGYGGSELLVNGKTQEVVELVALVGKVAARLGFELSNYERDQVLGYLERDARPFGILQDLVDDRGVTDVIVTDYSRVTIQQGRTNIPTSVTFPNEQVYQAFVERLLLKAGTTYSTKQPITDGMIGSFARIHAVHRSLCETGPYLTIRLNRISSVRTSELVQLGMAPQPLMDYLTGMVKIGQTLLLVGEVATGKTTLLRALAGAMPADEAVLVIEDTPEIYLDLQHVRYVRTREANSEGAGRVSPSECIRGGMRMAMSRIIFGEMRDAEAAEAFIDVCASGHPGLSTIHARSALEALTRLELFLGRVQKGTGREVVNEQITTAVKAIVYVGFCKETKRRRIMDVREIGPVADGKIRQREMFKYSVSAGEPQWEVRSKVSVHKAELEQIGIGVALAALPQTLTLDSSREM